MITLVQAEFRKLRTTRAPALIAIAVAVFAGLATVATLTAAGHQGNPPLGANSLIDAVRAPLSVLVGAVLMLGVLGVTGEYRHGTIVPSFLITPRRNPVIAAKVATHAIVGAGLSLAVSVVAVGVALPILAAHHVQLPGSIGTAALAAGGATAAAALYGALGAAIGAAIRHQTAAIITVLVWMLAIEGLIPDILRQPGLRQWLPWGAVKAVCGFGGHNLNPVSGGLLLITYTAAVGLLGTRAVRHADLA
jgi:ABC-2 type transport system permease protein